MTAGEFFGCFAVSLALGAVISLCHCYRNTVTKNFIITLVLIPAIVQCVIMLVNGNIGTGIAVMGAFSLVRFRSTPGNSREIAAVFLAMAVGLATGIGYLAMAGVLTAIIGLVTILLVRLPFGEMKENERELKITIPENLDYSGIFDDIFSKYTTKTSLKKVKTVNLGSMYELVYRIQIRDEKMEKQMIDDIRVRNGNLEISCGRVPEDMMAL